MSNEKLHEVGEMLSVTEKDIHDVKRSAFTNKVWYWIIGAAIAILAALLWFFTREDGGSGLPPGYPYTAALVLPHMLKGRKTGSKIAILLGSALTFLIALKASAVFGQAIEYNVYRR